METRTECRRRPWRSARARPCRADASAACRTDEGLEHQIELPRRRERALAAAHGTLRVGLTGRAFDPRIVGAKAILALLAVDEWIGESRDVPRRLPHLGMHQDRGVQALDVFARVDHRPPPALLDVLLELDAQRTVVPDGTEAAIDIGRLIYVAEPVGQRNDVIHDFASSYGSGGGRHKEAGS